MNSFRTEIPVESFPFEIDYKSKFMFLGSCFSDNMSQKTIQAGFSAFANPFGVLYNPISIKNGLDILMKNKKSLSKNLIQNQGLFHSFSHHGSFSKATKEEVLNEINASTKEHSKILRSCNYLFITFGTSYVYRYKKTQKIVSNCHKLPTKEFEHFALSTEEIVKEYKELILNLKLINPELKIIFTVSPVRHWKDGAHENQISKSILHLSINELQKQFDHVHYFPSYEIMMDDLRDYRFYADDMIHISRQAVDYIYEFFQKSFYSPLTIKVEKKVLKLKQALNHRPFNPETEEHQLFMKSTKQKINQLKQEYPDIIF